MLLFGFFLLQILEFFLLHLLIFYHVRAFFSEMFMVILGNICNIYIISIFVNGNFFLFCNCKEAKYFRSHFFYDVQ